MNKQDERQTLRKPNLVYIFADQMRGMDMGCAGNHEVITPNLDRLAKEGFMFKNAVSVFPVCSPQRASLISGRYPTTTGVMDNDVPLPIDGKGFGHVLKNSGYKTGWVGKWHLFGPVEVRETFVPPGEHRHGFDDLWAGVNCSHKYFDYFYFLNDCSEKVYFKGYEPDIQTNIAIDFITKHREEPFALFVSWGPPHNPYQQVPEQRKEDYKNFSLQFRSNVNENEKIVTEYMPGNIKNQQFDILSFYNSYTEDKEMRAYANKDVLKDYYAAITALDYNVGRLVQHLEELGISEETIVVFTSDHGDMMYSHRAIQKNYPWEESINIPFILRYSNIVESGRSTMRPFNTVDIMPTILELMGIDVPDYVEGSSFAPMLLGREQQSPEAAYIMCAWPWIIPEWRGIRTERYTYIESPEGPLMLYDNEKDPFQLRNVIEEKEYAQIRKELREIYIRMAREIGDNFEPWQKISDKMEKIRSEWMAKYSSMIIK